MKKSIEIEMSIKMHEGIYCQIKLLKNLLQNHLWRRLLKCIDQGVYEVF